MCMYTPPIQYKCPSRAATPQLLLLEDIGGISDQLPVRGSNLKQNKSGKNKINRNLFYLSTEAW